MPAIEVCDLSKTYRVYRKREGLIASIGGLFRREYQSVVAVDRVRFTIEAGEIVAFLGPNGAGKTTTLKLLSGLIFPTAGDARVLGYRPLEAGQRLPPPVFARHGAEKPALVGPACAGIVPPAPGDLPDRSGGLPAAARRADRTAGGSSSCEPAGAGAVVGRADADGADRRFAPWSRSSLAGRADDRTRRRLAAAACRSSCGSTRPSERSRSC